MKIEAGKYYKTRDGSKVGPITWNGENFGVLGHSIYYSDGSVSSSRPHQQDLISEWQNEASSFIRTVKRREIVPGVYGAVEVMYHDEGGLMVGISDNNWNASELREAAHILNQLAEALEENGK